MIKRVLFGFHSGYSAFKPITRRTSPNLAICAESSPQLDSQETVMERLRSTKFAISSLSLPEIQEWLKLTNDRLRLNSTQETIINADNLISKINTLTQQDYQSYCVVTPFEDYYGYLSEIIMIYQTINHEPLKKDTFFSDIANIYYSIPDEVGDKISSYIINIIQTSLTFINESPSSTLDNFYTICHILDKSCLNIQIAPVYFHDLIKKFSNSYSNIISLCSNPFPFLKELFYEKLGDILNSWNDQGIRFQCIHAEAFKHRLTYYFSNKKDLIIYLKQIDSLVDSSTISSFDGEDYSGPERRTTAFDFT